MSRGEFTLIEVGTVVKEVTGTYIQIYEEYRQGLLEMDDYSHIHVYWWANEFDNEKQRSVLVTDIPYSKEKVKAGVFSCRSPERPNLIMETVCKITGISHTKGKIYIENIDAFADTPVIDIKPYLACVDRVKSVKVPDWFPEEWGEWLPKGGIF